MSVKSRVHAITDSPEFNVVVFSFLLHFVWEMWQAPFYSSLDNTSHWQGVTICTQATLGDVVIALVAFYVASLVARSRTWMLRPGHVARFAFLGTGLLLTIIIEALATGPMERWSYKESMPTLPFLGTGLLPLIQWSLIPPLVLWFIRRQLQPHR